MKKQYNEPQIYVENVVVESGIAVSHDSIIIEDWREDDDVLEF